jgi:cell division protease FtsH
MPRRINPLSVLLLVILGLLLFNYLQGGRIPEVPYSLFRAQVEGGLVRQVTTVGREVEGEYKQAQAVPAPTGTGTVETLRFRTLLPSIEDRELFDLLRANDVAIDARQPSDWWPIVLGFLPIIILIALIYFLFMRSQGAQNQVMQFGQSKATLYDREKRVKTTFDDVAGHHEAKQELIEVIDFLKNPDKYTRIGAKIPKGVLLVGPPGTGKTLLARAVAGEAGVPFFSMSASGFMEMFVGVGASRVRNLFEDARRAAPCIVFVDELDSIGRRRGAGIGGGHDEREQTLNQILSEMDGFEKDTQVIVLAATNRPDILDPALLRPGRFDRQVMIGLPTVKEREAILKVHLRNKPVDANVDVRKVGEGAAGFSGADLQNLANEAALIAARRGSSLISQADFDVAMDKITMGLERSSLVLTSADKEATAFHEAGHAVAAHLLPELDMLRKVTIIPRGFSLGATSFIPQERVLVSKERMENELVTLLAGRVAERHRTGRLSTGAANDLKQATEAAKRMVLDYGMGDGSEFIAWGSNTGPVFLGGEITRRQDFSDLTAKEVDDRIEEILRRAYARCEEFVERQWPAIEALGLRLLEVESVDGIDASAMIDEYARPLDPSTPVGAPA